MSANRPCEETTAANLHDLAPEDLFDMVRDYRNAPSNTASAMTVEQWAPVGAAARAAARAALEPTVKQLQLSALLLVERMIEAK